MLVQHTAATNVFLMATTYTEYINKDRKDAENNQAPIKQYPEQNVVL